MGKFFRRHFILSFSFLSSCGEQCPALYLRQSDYFIELFSFLRQQEILLARKGCAVMGPGQRVTKNGGI